MNQQDRNYGIVPRPADLGGGWKLTLLEDGREAGGGVFPIPKEHPWIGMDWWNAITENQRRYWLMMAASAIPAAARHAYLVAEAYDEARQQGENWIR